MQSNTDTWIKTTANMLSVPEEAVMKVISHQWKSAKEATAKGSIIEISGLGRFQARMNKVKDKQAEFNRFYTAAKRKLDELTKEDDGWYRQYVIVTNLEKDINFLNTKKQDPTLIKTRAKKYEKS